MNPTFFYQNGTLSTTNFLSFDTKPSTADNLFLINRTSDNTQASFTNTQVTDGTYSTFVSGTTGKITNLKYGKLSLSQTVDTSKPLLIQNTNDPFLDFSQSTFLSGRHNLNIKRDFIFTIICNQEGANVNQRQNFGLLSSDKCYFSMILSPNSVNVTVDSTVPLPSTPNVTKSTNNLNAFRLITVTYINGVINVYQNNSILSNGGTIYSCATTPLYNNIILNGRGDGENKLNKYKHFSVRSEADLTSFNVSTYNQSIMTKYSIT